MKLVRFTALAVLLTASAFAQRGGFRGGFGGGGFRGGFVGGGFRGGFVGGGFHGGFRGGGFGFHQGGFRVFRPGFRSGFFFRQPFLSPAFAYPWYSPLWYDNYYAPPPAYDYGPAEPNVTVIYAPAPPPPAPAYMPETARPQMREYGSPPPRQQISFSFARRDGTVETAAGFWIDSGTVHMIDLDGHQHEMPLADVDRARTEKMNRDRGIEFRLPAR